MRPGSARLTVLSVMVVAALAAPAAAQTLYRWVDENGVVHYSQFPPPAPTAPPSPGPEGKPAAPPEAKPSPPGAKPSLPPEAKPAAAGDRKSTRLNSSHRCTPYAVFCLKKKNNNNVLPNKNEEA